MVFGDWEFWVGMKFVRVKFGRFLRGMGEREFGDWVGQSCKFGFSVWVEVLCLFPAKKVTLNL